MNINNLETGLIFFIESYIILTQNYCDFPPQGPKNSKGKQFDFISCYL